MVCDERKVKNDTSACGCRGVPKKRCYPAEAPPTVPPCSCRSHRKKTGKLPRKPSAPPSCILISDDVGPHPDPLHRDLHAGLRGYVLCAVRLSTAAEPAFPAHE